MNAKDYEAELKWFNSSEAKQRAAAAKPIRFQNSKSVLNALTYPVSKYKLTSIQIAKQLGQCFFQRAMVHTRRQILVAIHKRRFGISSRRWFSFSAIAVYTN